MDGAVCVGKSHDQDFLTIAEVKAALRHKPSPTRTVLWLTTCFSGFWTREPLWEAFAAARHTQESQSIPASPSRQYLADTSTALMHESFGSFGRQDACASPTQRSLPLPPFFSHSLLARLTLIPHIAVDHTTPTLPPVSRTGSVFVKTLPQRLESLSLEPHVHERLLVLARALNRDIDSYTLPTTPTFNRIATWVRLLGTPTFPAHVNVGVVLHALGQQAHLLFIADALHLTGAWSRSIAAADKNVDLLKEFSSRTGLTVDHLWEVLQTSHEYSQPPDATFRFNWSTGVVFRFLEAWHRAGYPQTDLEQVRDARAEVMVFVQRVGAENPELLCHCGQHLLLSGDEYEERIHQYRVDSVKEMLLGMAYQEPAITMSELRSVASAVGIAPYDQF